MRLQKLTMFVVCLAVITASTTIYFRQRGGTAPVAQASDMGKHLELESQDEQRMVEKAGDTKPTPYEIASGQIEPEAFASRASAKDQALQEFLIDARTQSHNAAMQRNSDLLKNAGFTQERIEWLRARAEELRAARQRNGRESDPYMSAAYMLDKDLDLVSEIGEDEYDRYRVALGRPIGISIDQAAPEPGVQVGGLQAGDVVVRVNGTRTYNGFMLSSAARDSGGRETSLVEVIRGGQRQLLTVPSEQLSKLRSEAPGAARLRALAPPPGAFP